MRLYAAAHAAALYPYDAPLVLRNTSRVDDAEAPADAATAEAFPRFAAAPWWEAELRAGQALLLPRGVWHHVRALSPSTSVSFWW